MNKYIQKLGKVIFSKVAIKPGRPLSFGILTGNLPILLLPGNPVASFVTFKIFAKYLLSCMVGNKKNYPYFFKVKSNFNMDKKFGREEYLRGKINIKNEAIYVDKFNTEGAGILTSVSWSDGLIRLAPQMRYVRKGDILDFMPYNKHL